MPKTDIVLPLIPLCRTEWLLEYAGDELSDCLLGAQAVVASLSRHGLVTEAEEAATRLSENTDLANHMLAYTLAIEAERLQRPGTPEA